jgi:hypothetical protein
MWAYIRSREVSGIVERAHGNFARKPKRWVEHEIGHAAETREAPSQFHRSAGPCWNTTSRVSGKVSRRVLFPVPLSDATLKLFQQRRDM